MDTPILNEESDTELIECNRCKAVLNGESLWILGETAETVCESYYTLEKA